MRMRIPASIFVYLVWALVSGTAFAADDPAKLQACRKKDTATVLSLPQRLSSLIVNDCLRLDEYTPEDLRPVRDLLGGQVKTEMIPARTLRVVGDLTSEIEAEAETRTGLEASFFDALLERALRARRAVAEEDEGERYRLAEEWQYQSPPGLVGSAGGIEIDQFLMDCPKDPDEPTWNQHECSVRYQIAKDVLVRARLMERALTDAQRPGLIAAARANKVALDRWDAYFNDTRSQYLWELLINQRRLNRNDSRPEAGGVKLGFREVPENQLILLHPGVAFEYLDDAADGSQFKETAILEVFGFNRWRWDGSDPKNAWGFSLMAAWTDRAASDDFGYGFMLHFAHRFSIGVADHGGELGVLVSADVSTLWLKVKESRKKLMRGDG